MSEVIPAPAAATSEAGATSAVIPAEPAAAPVVEVPKDLSNTEVKPPAAAPVVPEKYELKTAEGTLLNPEHVKEIETYAKSKGLTNEQAQEILTREESLLSKNQADSIAQHERTVDAWVEATKNDKEIGGAKFAESVEHAHRAYKHFDPDGRLQKDLDASGFGNHPEVIRVFAKIGQAMANDRLVKAPAATSVTPKRGQDIMYDGNKARNKS